jgi:hypothetical protein
MRDEVLAPLFNNWIQSRGNISSRSFLASRHRRRKVADKKESLVQGYVGSSQSSIDHQHGVGPCRRM